VVGLHGKSVDPKKLANIDSWSAPTTGKQVQSYLRTFNFFCEFIPMYSTVAAPLDALRNKSGHFVLNKTQKIAFETMKELLTRAPILSFADFSKPFYVVTDASDMGIGAVLYQLPRGNQYPKEINYISFMAQSLQERERRYSATKKELLGIVFALNKFHYYLWGQTFQLFTDHRALTFLHSQQNLNSMMTTWQDTILNYTFTINYWPGILNILPNALSQLFQPMLKESQTSSMSSKVSFAFLLSDEYRQNSGITENVPSDLGDTERKLISEKERDEISVAYMHVIQNNEAEREEVHEKDRNTVLH
jgi:hypothetical protein